MITIRPERDSDWPSIFDVHAASFPTDAEARLVSALRDAGRLVVSLVAAADAQVIGHVAFSPVTVAGGAKGVGLAPLAVLPAFRKRGVAAQLARQGVEACAAARFTFVVVLGSPAYYGRFGFRPASLWGLGDEYGGGNAFQALELQRGGIPHGAGLVRYAPEFAAFAD